MKVLRSWTAHQALAAQKKFQASGHSYSDPRGPVFVWCALNELETLRARFKRGDRMALMIAIRLCANHDLVMPPWVATAYIDAFDRVNHYRAESWNQVFGEPNKGKHLAKQRLRETQRWQVFKEIHALRQKRRTHQESLEIVAQTFGISESYAGELFSECKRFIETGTTPVKHHKKSKIRGVT